jgi:HEAT repeat protein
METGRFDDFVDVYNAIFSDALSGKYRTEASSMLDYIYHTESFVARSVESIKLWGKHEWPSAVRLADAQRRHLLGPIFDALADEEDSSMRNFLLELIGRLKFDVLEEAVTRLEDNRWYVVRNMINVIRKMEGNRFSDRIARFMNHPNPKVAMEAVETLMYFKHPDVLTTLRKILYGDDLELRDEAIRLAGLYKVREAVPPLLSLLERPEYRSSGTSYKLLVVKSLHEIGDPRAIDSFVRVFKSDTLLNGPALDDLKTAIFEGLSNYSPDTVKPLLLLGSRSSVSAVRSISEELLKTIGSH